MSRETAVAKVSGVQLARTKGDGNAGGSGGVRVDDQAATDMVDAVKTTTTTTTSVSAQSFDSIQEDEATTPSGRPVGLRLAESGEDDARRPRTGTSSGDSKSVAQRGSSISVAGPAVCSGPAPASPKLSKGGHAPALPVVADSLAHPSPQEEGPQSQTGLIFERFTVWLTESVRSPMLGLSPPCADISLPTARLHCGVDGAEKRYQASDPQDRPPLHAG